MEGYLATTADDYGAVREDRPFGRNTRIAEGNLVKFVE